MNLPLMLVWPPTVIIISSPRGMLMPPAMANKMLKKRIFWFIYQKWLLYKVDAFHTTGQIERKSCLYFYPKIFSFIVKNGIDVPDLRSIKPCERNSLDPITFGFLGRIHPIKNIDILVKSWSMKPNSSNKAKLIICGPDRENHLSYLKSLAAKLGTENLYFRDEVQDKGKEKFFKELDCLILPSKSENFGMVVAEALAHGVPVICTAQAPWSELNDQKIGWSIPICVDRLTTAISEASSMRAELKKMGMRVVLMH